MQKHMLCRHLRHTRSLFESFLKSVQKLKIYEKNKIYHFFLNTVYKPGDVSAVAVAFGVLHRHGERGVDTRPSYTDKRQKS